MRASFLSRQRRDIGSRALPTGLERTVSHGPAAGLTSQGHPKSIDCSAAFVLKHDRATKVMTVSASERKAICELAKYITTPAITDTLGSLAEHDSSREVRYAAFDALSFQRQLTSIRTLMAAFPSATPERQWSLLAAILDAADPYLYTDSEDELWLGRILVGGVPAAYERHANAVLERRRQKEKQHCRCH
jgi:hypothetical protein